MIPSITKLIYAETKCILLGWKHIYFIVLKGIEKHTLKTNNENERLRQEIENLRKDDR